jgi:tight adherence protein C
MIAADLLPFGVSSETAITTIAAIAGFVVACVVWQALLTSDPMAARARRLGRRRQELRVERESARRAASRRQRAASTMRIIARRFDLLRNRTTTRATERLACAGWRSHDATVAYMVVQLCAPFVFGAVSLLLIRVLGILPLDEPLRSLAPLLAVGLGFYAPRVFVSNAITRRQKVIQKGLPDALDLLVICAEAGLSLDAALTRVAAEMDRSCPPIADELGLTAVELGFLPERRQALKNLTLRCPMPSIRGVVNTLAQTERYGTPLSKALRVLSAEYRNDRMMKAEEKAARLPAILTIPMILFILPALFIVLGGPAALRVVDSLRGM